MNGPNDLDDGWAELARELGLEGDRPFPTAAPDHPAADLHPPEDPTPETDDEEFVEEPGEAPTSADVYAQGEAETEESDVTDDGDEIDGEGDSADTGEPGEPKKKRRRRRRRKKKPGDGSASEATLGEDSSEEPGEVAEVEDLDESALPGDGLVEEEGASPAATRELIANWDVPSWESIVQTMLFRPQGR